MMWINGEIQTVLAANDRAVQFGDGCFTTARIRQGETELLSEHVQRLQKSCECLLITGIDWTLLRQEMLHAAREYGDGVLKVIISRGSGGRGYSAVGCGTPTRIISVSPYPVHYHRLREEGVRLSVSPVRLSKNPLLAGIKHLNRLEQVLIRTHLEQTDADEALVLDTDDMLVECCAANFFWRRGDQVFTPDLSLSGVAGLQRHQMLSRIPPLGFTVQIVRAGLDELLTAEEVFITNALMPVLPVMQIDGRNYHSRHLFNLLTPH